MIDVENFNIIFQTVYFFFALIALIISIQSDRKEYSINGLFFSRILMCLLFLIIGLRGYDVGADTLVYKLQWDDISFIESPNTEFLHFLLMRFLQYLGFSFQSFLLSMSFLYVFIFYIGIRKISEKYNANPFLVLFVFISSFFFMSMGVNVIRQGVSLGLFFLYIAYYDNLSKLKKIALILLSIFTHFTSIIPIFIFYVVVKRPKIKINHFYLIYFFAIVLSALQFGVLNLSEYVLPFVNEARKGYLSGEESGVYVTGFKAQFAVFNTLFLLLFIYIRKFIKNIKVFESYDIYLKYYLITSSIFFLMFQIPYSDRVGLMGWITIPILCAPVYSKYFRKKWAKTLLTLFFLFIFLFFLAYE